MSFESINIKFNYCRILIHIIHIELIISIDFRSNSSYWMLIEFRRNLKPFQSYFRSGMAKGGVFQKPPLELKILENPPPLEKFWNTPPSKIRREAPAPNWI